MSVISNTPPYDYEWTQDYPELGKGPVSTEPFLSPAYYESERSQGLRIRLPLIKRSKPKIQRMKRKRFHIF